jgi:hypothetical protein
MVGMTVFVPGFRLIRRTGSGHRDAEEDFQGVVFEICKSLQTHGVNNILVLNGRGGNVVLLLQCVTADPSNFAVPGSGWRNLSSIACLDDPLIGNCGKPRPIR